MGKIKPPPKLEYGEGMLQPFQPVQVLALQGSVIALGYALFIRHILLTFSGCLQPSAAAIRILAVASPTEIIICFFCYYNTVFYRFQAF